MKISKSLLTALSLVVLSSPALASDPQQTLIGGKPADISKYPASISISAGGSRCTAAVVGSRVVYTAAHCVNNGGSISFSVGANRYTATCTHHASYRNNSTADWALCATNKEVTGIEFERVNTDNSILQTGKKVELTGYGCTRPGGSGGNDGTYRIGEAVIRQTPSGTNYDIVTSRGAALCFGDSGGPAFMYLDETKTDRVLISINSRGDIQTTSYLSNVAAATALEWAERWAASKQVKICGINSDATGCRNTNITPPQPESRECIVATESKAMETWTACLKKSEEVLKTDCESALNLMGACYLTKYPRQ